MSTGEFKRPAFMSTPNDDRHEFPSVNGGTHDSLKILMISKPHQAILEPQSYSPQILTIGPLHEMLDGSSSFDHYKAPCVDRFMRRHIISDMDELVRRLNYNPLHMHYSSLPDNSSNSLELLVTGDTVFIHEFLLFLWNEMQLQRKQHDHFPTLCNNDLTYKRVWRDLFVMGNQIPMSFLMKLIEEFPNPPNLDMDEIQEVLVDVIKRIDPFPISHSQHEKFETPKFVHCNHLLDCLYVWIKRKPFKEHGRQAISPRTFSFLHKAASMKTDLPSASQLSRAGISFRAIEGSISVMKYDKRNLWFDLPRLVMEDSTVDVFKNVLAYEESLTNTGGEFSVYVVTMDSLIKSQEDLAILTKAQVVASNLESNERIVQMWNAMSKNIMIHCPERWNEMIDDVMEHYRTPLHRRQACPCINICEMDGAVDAFHISWDSDRHKLLSPRFKNFLSPRLLPQESSMILKPHQALVEVNPGSYSPQILTIGPLYQMLDRSRSFDQYKAPCVDGFMRRHRISDKDELMRRLDYNPRYLQYPSLNFDSLKLLVTEDTVFIHEFLLFLWYELQPQHTEHGHFPTLYNNDLTYKQVWRDLFLMGNQIPMSYLKKLIEEFPNPPNLEMDEIRKVVAHAVKRIDPFPFRNSQNENFGTPNFVHCNHLLDCLYVWVTGKPLEDCRTQTINSHRFPQQADPLTTDLPSASQLSKAGIRFRAIEGSISVMKYDKRKLRFDLPGLVVQDNTEDVLKNLLAYEETLINTGHEFSLYVVTMDSLIKTQEDLEILSKAFVIQSELGSSERLLQMWSAMAKNVVIRSREKWEEMIHDVMEHCESPRRFILSILLCHGI